MKYNLDKLLEKFILKVELQLQTPPVLLYLPTVQTLHSGILRQKRRTFQTAGITTSVTTRASESKRSTHSN